MNIENIIDRLTSIADSHTEINGSGYGYLADIQHQPDKPYPFMAFNSVRSHVQHYGTHEMYDIDIWMMGYAGMSALDGTSLDEPVALKERYRELDRLNREVAALMKEYGDWDLSNEMDYTRFEHQTVDDVSYSYMQLKLVINPDCVMVEDEGGGVGDIDDES